MNDLIIFPDQLTAMSVSQLQALPPAHLVEVQRNLGQLADWLKKEQAKVHTAMQQRFEELERVARAETGKDFGTVRFQEGPLCVSVDKPKRVSWDQKQLAEVAKRIAASGDRVEDYLDIEFSVPESRFNNWPTSLREQFEAARTVKPGKAIYVLDLDSEE